MTLSTSYQRLYIRTLMRGADLDTDRFIYQHRGPFKAAGLPEPPFDGHIDAHLRELKQEQASALIGALKKLGSNDDGEEDER